MIQQEKLVQNVITVPLQEQFEETKEKYKSEGKTDNQVNYLSLAEGFDIIIELNPSFPGGVEMAKKHIIRLISRSFIHIRPEGVTDEYISTTQKQGVKKRKTEAIEQYVFARLSRKAIHWLVDFDLNGHYPSAIYQIWPDFKIQAQINESQNTIKLNEVRATFVCADGRNIVWAVMDSGIDERHPHFKEFKNLILDNDRALIKHRDFSIPDEVDGNTEETPLIDENGHGTHVAGIIAGRMIHTEEQPNRVQIKKRIYDENGDSKDLELKLENYTMSGMAPQCKLVSLKVLDKNGIGDVSNLLEAIEYLRKINSKGSIFIHGVNMSLGYTFKPQWLSCGHTPLCNQVNELVKSGVVVVAASGNTGYGQFGAMSEAKAMSAQFTGMYITINDPGNAEEAITVGSTHRCQPEVYGVSHFSSKGPTADGRLKPDLVAPGEEILSCTADNNNKGHNYEGMSGTSMATPHVSGAIAAFLSMRREYIGSPREVKDIFLLTAIDLKRDKYFQGHGLVNLMGALNYKKSLE